MSWTGKIISYTTKTVILFYFTFTKIMIDKFFVHNIFVLKIPNCIQTVFEKYVMFKKRGGLSWPCLRFVGWKDAHKFIFWHFAWSFKTEQKLNITFLHLMEIYAKPRFVCNLSYLNKQCNNKTPYNLVFKLFKFLQQSKRFVIWTFCLWINFVLPKPFFVFSDWAFHIWKKETSLLQKWKLRINYSKIINMFLWKSINRCIAGSKYPHYPGKKSP